MAEHLGPLRCTSRCALKRPAPKGCIFGVGGELEVHPLSPRGPRPIPTKKRKDLSDQTSEEEMSRGISRDESPRTIMYACLPFVSPLGLLGHHTFLYHGGPPRALQSLSSDRPQPIPYQSHLRHKGLWSYNT